MGRKKIFGGIHHRRPLLFWAALAFALLAMAGTENHSETLVVAHRAGAAAAPENTLAALERAIAAGADMAEIDARMTRDGVLVVTHDGSLKRTTGADRKVWETDCAVIQSLDAGGWYSGSFAGERVPTLKEVLASARGRIRLMIELKCSPQDQELVERAVAEIQAAGMADQCALACTDLSLLRRSKELAPELDTIFVGKELDSALCGLDYIDGCNIHSAALTRSLVAQAHGAGKAVYAWTVNGAAEMNRALSLGVDGLVTDDPELAARQVRG